MEEKCKNYGMVVWKVCGGMAVSLDWRVEFIRIKNYRSDAD